MTPKLCRLRLDLYKNKTAIRLGGDCWHEGDWFCSLEPLEYNWLNDGEDYFEVLYKGEWVEAESVDFDFIN